MQRRLSLAALTVLDLSLPEMVRCAAETGYDQVGIRLIPSTPEEPQHDTRGITPLVRETRRISQDLGIPILDVETIRLRAETGIDEFTPFFEAGEHLGATDIVVAGLDDDLSRLADNFGILAQRSAEFGLTPNLEFMPWTAVPDLATAVEVLHRSGHSNVGLLVDTLHFDRSDSDPRMLEDVPTSWSRYAQVCDGPRERPTDSNSLIFAARHDRLMPGDGDINLEAILAPLPNHIPLSVEVPIRNSGLTARERAALGVRKTQRLALDYPPNDPPVLSMET